MKSIPRGLVVALSLAAVQEALFALLFLSYMNYYVLDVLGAAPGVPGYTLAMYGAVKLVVHPIAGRVIDGSPRRAFATAIAAQCSGVGILLSFQVLSAFLVATVLLGVGSAIVWPLIYHTIASTQSITTRPRAMGLMSVVAYSSTLFGFGVGVVLARDIDHRFAFAVLGVLALAEAVLLRAPIFDRQPKAQPAVGSPRTADPIHQRSSTRIRAALRQDGVFLVAVILFLHRAAIASIGGVYGPFVRTALDISLMQALIYGVPAVCAAALSLYASSYWSRPSRRFAEMSFFFLCAGIGALALAGSPNAAGAALAAVPLAVGIGGLGPLVAATLMDASGDHNRGLVLGTLMSVGGMGSVAGPALVGSAATLINARAGVALLGIIFLLIVPLTLLVTHSRTAHATTLST